MNGQTDIKDVTFLLRVRIDSVDRLENLLMVTDFLSVHFDTNIHVLEATGYNNKILRKLLHKNVSVTFIGDYDPVFHQTKYLNMMAKNCQTPYLAVWDVDVIVPPEQIILSVDLLQKQEADFVSPYKDKALDTTGIIRELYLKKRDINILTENKGKMTEIHSPNPFVGGAVFARSEAYIHAGMENEHFYGWGGEDDERVIRWEILGYRFKRVPGHLFHLTHKRGMNSNYYSDGRKDITLSELFRILAMSRNELEVEINTWKP